MEQFQHILYLSNLFYLCGMMIPLQFYVGSLPAYLARLGDGL